MLLAGICADGSCLPPAICTDDKKCPKITFEHGSVIKVGSSRGGSVDSVRRLFDTLKPYLEDEPYILMDDLKAHSNPLVKDMLEEQGATVMIFPKGTGKLLDPVDNSFNSPLKTHYYQYPKSTHTEMLTAIYNSYYKATEESIQRYWYHIGYTSHQKLDTIVKNLALQGYCKGAISEDVQKNCVQMYEKWKKNVRDLWEHGTSPSEPPCDLPMTSLDGQYWRAYHV